MATTHLAAYAPVVDTLSKAASPTIGLLVRSWRAATGKSQQELALQARISSRHLSFIETGRSNPSREMVVTLADALEVPLRDRNAWLQAAGYAPLYRETPLDAPSMEEVRAAIGYLLDAFGDHPAFVVNSRFDVLMSNDAAKQLLAFFAPGWRGPANFLEMLFAHDGLRDAIANWVEVVAHGVDRVRRELSRSRRDAADDALLQKVLAAEREVRAHGRLPAKMAGLVLPVTFRRGGVELELFSTITTLGTPLDITLQELRIETFFPATRAAREGLRTVTKGSPDA
jgi:transcriptional regulator with XRE-family HTH domain